MKIANLYTISLLIFVVFASSCTETVDPFETSNNQPVLMIKSPYLEEFGDFDIDSVKLGKNYTLLYKVDDEEADLKTDINYSDDWPVDFKNGALTFSPEEEGNTTLNLSVCDSYGLTSDKEIELVCFKNLSPVADAKSEVIAILSPLERKINALSSYDKDRKFGGYLTAYEFTVTGNKTVINNDGFIYYVFPQTGSYRVKVRVRDNDMVWSQDHYIDVLVE